MDEYKLVYKIDIFRMKEKYMEIVQRRERWEGIFFLKIGVLDFFTESFFFFKNFKKLLGDRENGIVKV